MSLWVCVWVQTNQVQALSTYLVPQEDVVNTLCSMVPDDQQAPAVANKNLGGVLEVSLE